MKLQPYSSKALALCGIILMGMGLYFAFLRPPFLPEDVRYIGASIAKIQGNVPHLLNWLNKVFWVMGAYIFTSGLLTLYTAATSFRKRARGAAVVLVLAGFTSLGWMTIVNFIISSDFKWLLLVFETSCAYGAPLRMKTRFQKKGECRRANATSAASLVCWRAVIAAGFRCVLRQISQTGLFMVFPPEDKPVSSSSLD